LTVRGFWLETLERAVKSAAQAALLTLGAGRLDAFTADWELVAGFSLGMAILSVLTSFASIEFGKRAGDHSDPSPSLV
jgi:hypothetical protein